MHDTQQGMLSVAVADGKNAASQCTAANMESTGFRSLMLDVFANSLSHCKGKKNTFEILTVLPSVYELFVRINSSHHVLVTVCDFLCF